MEKIRHPDNLQEDMDKAILEFKNELAKTRLGLLLQNIVEWLDTKLKKYM